MKNSTDLRGCYPPRPSASVNTCNCRLDLQNSSYPTRPYSIIANNGIIDICKALFHVDVKFEGAAAFPGFKSRWTISFS